VVTSLTFGNNSLKLTYSSHTPKVLYPHFTAPELEEAASRRVSIATMSSQLLQGINT